jgi:hypothetical protein
VEERDRSAAPERVAGHIMNAKPLASEGDLLAMLMQAVPYAIPDALIFRRPIISVKAEGGWWAKAGVRGQADAYIVMAGGRHIEIETKAAVHKWYPQQRAWRARCEELRIPYLVLRAGPGEVPGDTVERWIAEIKAIL